MSETPSRPDLNGDRLRAHVVRAGGLWHTVRILDETESTNDVATTAALAGEPEGLVVVAENQSHGRGRNDREWVSPRGAGLTFSLLLRPDDVPQHRWGWLPLLAGTAIATALAEATQIETRLKWPNDLLLGAVGRKAGGILSAVAGDAVVVGIGLNVTTTAAELPIAAATSLLLEGASTVDRTVVLGHVLDEIARDYGRWRVSQADPSDSELLERYRSLCATIGTRVCVTLPGGEVIEGTAVDVAPSGALRLDGPSGPVTVSAGDVTHLRPAGGE